MKTPNYAEECDYAILVLEGMKLKFFKSKDDFAMARETLLRNEKRLVFFKKSKGFWIQPEVLSFD